MIAWTGREEWHWPEEPEVALLRGWRLVLAWVASFIGSWGLVYGVCRLLGVAK